MSWLFPYIYLSCVTADKFAFWIGSLLILFSSRLPARLAFVCCLAVIIVKLTGKSNVKQEKLK